MKQGPVITIRPPRAFGDISVRELWRFRGFLLSMTRRRLLTEFDDQYLAILWAIGRPLLMVAVFALLRNFSAAEMGVHIPYPLYVYSGLVLWFFFAEALNQTATSIKQNAALIQKVYFPRILAPLSTILAELAILSISAIPLVLLLIYYGEPPSWRIILLPLVLLQITLLLFGAGCLFASLGLMSSDWDKFLSFALYVGLFVSPVIYSPQILPSNVLWIYSLNPLVGPLLAFRSVLIDAFPWPTWEFYYSAAFSILLAITGLLAFQRAERTLSERI